MKLGFQHLVCLGLPFVLAACGSDTPSFVEKPEGIITLTLDKSATDDDSFDMDELMGEDAESADAIAYSGDFSETGEAMDAAETGEAMDAAEDVTKGKNGRGKNKNSNNVASNDSSDSASSADAMPVTNTPDSASGSNTPDSGTGTGSGSTGGSTGSTPDSSFDSKAVAKACLPHFRGLSQKIKVVDPSATNDLRVAPGTVLAFKLTGNYSSMNLYLPAGNDVPGVCFFVAGNKAEVKFTTGSQINGLAYIAAGNQSSGAIEFLGGSPIRSHIELKGNQAALNVVGLDSKLCQGANLKGNDPQFQCNP
ncbi:MAG TPA: hypothetical protein VFO10_03495 [Oligoflexus sp.]|uniref:hypothetical protein n=1 Tax=Oligoflexus sp. TaxID=1971216 RepID=UPI002D7F1D98|nr:hypothetical protein [Oligoflexus sp.]HET9236288.1 hypothetical protein [Oligoflexus sp.]